MVLAIVDEARARRFRTGVIGVRGLPDPAVAADVSHAGGTVAVRPARSALAVREVLAEHRAAVPAPDWLVVVTDRDAEDLGAGILAHFVWPRLRTPDPWEAVRHRFAATGVDPALTQASGGREIATALLAATPATGWPVAPAGILSRAHALGAVAAHHLGFDAEPTDVLGVLRWSMRPASLVSLGQMRRDVGDPLTDATLDWIAQRAGVAEPPVRALLARGELTDIVPVGLVLALLTGTATADPRIAHQAQLALVRLEPRWSGAIPSSAALSTLGRAAEALLTDLVNDRRADTDVARALERADTMLGQLKATDLGRHSEVLAGGLRARMLVLAETLRRSAREARGGRDSVEAAWAEVTAHRLGNTSALRRPMEAAVRLVRWLELDVPDESSSVHDRLAAATRRHLAESAWADAAINDVFAGVDDPELSPALQAVVAAAQERRRGEERRFAAALAAASSSPSGNGPDDGIWYLERLLPGAVLPLVRRAPVLLLVMDGMSVATAVELLDDATQRLGWLEASLPGGDSTHRAGALAALPSLTEVSRTSLLCGRLVVGQQPTELKGFAELTSKAGKITARLFHKKAVDSTAAGWSVSHDVGDALDDAHVALVTVVLNTIDDALDRSDPAGTVWTADAVKHLEPLLARAAAAGRTVVITADHGHVVERRQGAVRSFAAATSNRSRPVDAGVGEDEVLVSGPRVLTDDHRAVLAVDENLRYGPLKAGYHGGASAAEVVVPVAVLVPDEQTNPAGLRLLPPQQPPWWFAAVPATVVVPVPVTEEPLPDDGTLFPVAPAAQAKAPASLRVSVGTAIVRTSRYKAQRKTLGRAAVPDVQLARLVDALHEADGHRLGPIRAAQALGVASTQLPDVIAAVQQLLNVEGYPVVTVQPTTSRVTLDVPLLTEQFDVNT
jgi:hypothetical protein